MIIATWIIAGLVAAANLLAGAAKLLTPEPKLRTSMPYIDTVGIGWTRVAAVFEVVGAAGVLVPLALSQTSPGWEWAKWVSVAAACGLAAVQVLALRVHRSRREKITTNVVLLVLAGAAAAMIAAS